jgi:AbrB family looped-hinge helix DNA binding protein
MSAGVSVKVNAKGRLSIPRDLREALGIRPGDTLFVAREGDGLRYAKAENPFDVLAEHALSEHRAGRTKRLRDFAAENGIALDADLTVRGRVRHAGGKGSQTTASQGLPSRCGPCWRLKPIAITAIRSPEV